ncbi:MAG: hypothetical protein P0119_09620 [Nitrospira sp.]|nr:hypothetical protein [Nitrospira sp.]
MTGFFLFVGLSILTLSPTFAEERTSPTLLAQQVVQRADQFAPIDSDEKAMTLFTTAVGPALGLKDAAGILGAKRLPSKMVNELKLAELSQSVYELMAALATWQLANPIRQAVEPSAVLLPPAAARQEWLRARSRSAALSDLLRITQEDQTLRASQPTPGPHNTELLLAAERTAFESSQQAIAAWWEIYGWKDRIRQTKGRARLCGTWQWTIHNHQHHEEQKNTLVFPPDGQVPSTIPALSEMIILGDSIYLRWEQNGHMQEDSLLFIKDNTKIEGSFVNNMGGWGAISGKRTAACKP